MPRVPQSVVNVRVPLPLLEAVDAYADRVGVARSTALKALVEVALRDADLWPPVVGAGSDRVRR
jgi:hypothetical protein